GYPIAAEPDDSRLVLLTPDGALHPIPQRPNPRPRLLLPTPDTNPTAVVDLLHILNDAYNTPWLYLLIAFGYAILVALVLPIPIEIALLLPLIEGRWGYLASIGLAIAAGKTVGAWLIFWLGLNLEGSVRKWSERWR